VFLLLAPPNRPLWIIPAVGVAFALGALTLWLRKRPPSVPPLPPIQASDDPYRQQILRELGE
jgi:hypothetical protein